jgi:prepilin-type N-terminal cleavage/methylation domain-containing protein
MNLLKNKKNNSRGFTLIELLVVVAILGLLASIVLVNVNSAKTKTRDVLRKVELKQLQSALENYYGANGLYPSTDPDGLSETGVWYSSEVDDNGFLNGLNNDGNWIPGLSPEYVSELPTDPKGGTSPIEYCNEAGHIFKSAYLYISNGLNYKLLSHCAFENNSSDAYGNSSDTYTDPVRSAWSWMVTNNTVVPSTGCSGYGYPSFYPVCW